MAEFPQSRTEEILYATINGEEYTGLPESRIEELLLELKEVIEESFDFNHNPICLNNNGISLKDYFTEITKAEIKEEGLYFEGPQLYQ